MKARKKGEGETSTEIGTKRTKEFKIERNKNEVQ